MKPKRWIVTLVVKYAGDDEGRPTMLRYGVEATTSEIALIRAGMRLLRKMPGADPMDASVSEEKHETARVIEG